MRRLEFDSNLYFQRFSLDGVFLVLVTFLKCFFFNFSSVRMILRAYVLIIIDWLHLIFDQLLAFPEMWESGRRGP